MAAMIVILCLVLLGMTSYLHFYLRRFFRLHLHRVLTRRQNRLLWIGCGILALPMLWINSLYTLAMLHFLVISAILDLVYVISRRSRIVGKICTTGVLAIGLTVLVLGLGAYNMFHVVRTDYTLRSNKTDGFTIVQISDIHTTGVSTPEHLARYCDEISQLNPDLILLTGDIFEEETTLADLRAVCQMLGQLTCKQGIYFSYGNHDSAFYTKNPHYTPEELRTELEKNGITILQDTAVTIGNVTIVGRVDISMDAGRKSTAQLLEGVDMDNYIVVMDHQPLELEENAAAGADLQLSGHTHGGQIFPLGLLTELITGRLNNGSRTIGGFTAITSSGFAGWGYPVKTEGRAEYVYIQILPES